MINSAWANERQELLGRISKLEQLTRRIPSRFAGGGAATTAPAIYVIQGNNALPGSAQVGIAKRSDTVISSELPVPVITPTPVSGDTATVPAFPAPSPLPNGIGIAIQMFTGTYVFVVLDSRSGVGYDLFAGNQIFSGGTVNIDLLSGGITYRYTCHVPAGAR